jgi:hypothetical protein
MFLKFSETVLEDEDGMQLMAHMLGHFIYSIYSHFQDLIIQNAGRICKFYDLCSKSKLAQTRENAAYNFPCVFNIFGKMKTIDFPEIVMQLTKIEEEK